MSRTQQDFEQDPSVKASEPFRLDGTLSQSKSVSGFFPLLTVLGIPWLEIDWQLSLDFSRLDISLVARFGPLTGLTLWQTSLTPTSASATFSGDQGVLREKLSLSVDLSLGDFHISASVGFWLPVEGWSDVDVDEHILWNPTLGSVGNDSVAHAPVVNYPPHGASISFVPTVTGIVVDEKARAGTDVGSKVKRLFFAEEPDFLFNVCFAVGEFVPGMAGPYGDPSSSWFNVFVGYYEINVPESRGRPFGYKTSSAANRELDPMDMIRIGKADWNYFSNYMYGVPEQYIVPHNTIPTDVPYQQTTERIGNKEWDLLILENFEVVSAYDPGGKELVNNSTILSPIWRLTFGGPAPYGAGQPFIGTKMEARMFMSFRTEQGRYKTAVFGGTRNLQNDPKFLDAQMVACRDVIQKDFSSLGF